MSSSWSPPLASAWGLWRQAAGRAGGVPPSVLLPPAAHAATSPGLGLLSEVSLWSRLFLSSPESACPVSPSAHSGRSQCLSHCKRKVPPLPHTSYPFPVGQPGHATSLHLASPRGWGSLVPGLAPCRCWFGAIWGPCPLGHVWLKFSAAGGPCGIWGPRGLVQSPRLRKVLL